MPDNENIKTQRINKKNYKKTTFNRNFKYKNNNYSNSRKNKFKKKLPFTMRGKLIKPKKRFYARNYKKNYIGNFAYWENTDERENLFCSASEELISNFEAFVDLQDENKAVNFEYVLNSIKKNETVKEDQTLIYIGNNKFAIIEKKKKTIIVKTIETQRRDNFSQGWQDKLQFQMHRIKPVAISLKEMYSDEDLKSFPKLGSNLLSNFLKQELK